MEMTKQYLKELCAKHDLYRTPYLNDVLYLHYKVRCLPTAASSVFHALRMFLQGFRLIENLEEYTGLKVAYLEGNGLVEISGLECQTEMRSLYLHENCIDRIQGLSHMV